MGRTPVPCSLFPLPHVPTPYTCTVLRGLSGDADARDLRRSCRLGPFDLRTAAGERGPVAQWQSKGLITSWSQVRTLPGPQFDACNRERSRL